MTLKELMNVMDDEIAVTIHREGEYDGDYLNVSDIEEELHDMKVIKIETPANRNKTDIRITLG